VLTKQPETSHFCRAVPSPLFATALINDVRPAGSAIMTYWLHFAVRASIAQAPWPLQALHTPLNIIGSASLAQGSATLMVPLSADLVSFYTFRMPASGRLGHVYPHTHAIMCEEMLLFAAPPEFIGLALTESAADVLSRTGAVHIAQLGHSKVSLRKLLHSHIQPTCSFTPWPSVEVQNLDGVAHSADCSMWVFKADDVTTTVAFFGLTRQLPKQMLNASEYEMHFYWQIYYYPIDAPKYSTAFTASFHDAFDAELSRHDILRALLLSAHHTINEPRRWPFFEEATVSLLLACLLIGDELVGTVLLFVYVTHTTALYSTRSSMCLRTSMCLSLLVVCAAYVASVGMWYAFNVMAFHEPLMYTRSKLLHQTSSAVVLGNVFIVAAFHLGYHRLATVPATRHAILL